MVKYQKQIIKLKKIESVFSKELYLAAITQIEK